MLADQVAGADRKTVSDAWGEWVAGLGDWHVFGGLTYDQSRRDRVPGSDSARAHIRRWLGDGVRKDGVGIEAAVVALEYQKTGWPHFHPLLRVAGGLHAGEITRLAQRWFRAHGAANLSEPRSVADVCAYAAKYLAKDLDHGDVIFWPARGSLSVHQPGLGHRPAAGHGPLR